MAKKVSENKITSLSQDWGRDESNGLPYSGQAVQDFIKEGISTANTAYSERWGAVAFDASTYTLLGFKNDEDKQAYLSGGPDSLVIGREQFNFTGTVNQLKVINGMDSGNLFFTTTQEKAEITVGFVSQQKGITDAAWEEVLEDFSVTVAVDKGASGTFENIMTDRTVLNGQTLIFDVKKYIATGSNRVRVSATGQTTGATANFIYSVTLTTMYLAPSKFNWQSPFVEGKTYSLGGLNIGGNIQKSLKIHVTGEGYDKLYEVNLGTNTYTTTSYFFGGLEFPTAGTGVYHFELWLDASGLESDHLHYDILCIAAADTASALYVIVNDVADRVMNGSDSKVFSYTLYNGGASTGSATVSIKVGEDEIIQDTLSNVPTGQVMDYNANIEYETEASGLMVTATITSGNTETVTLPLDNSASFPATSGASFYLNAATRNNAQENRGVVINEADGSQVAVTWTDVSYVDGMDGWTVDDGGRKCLFLPATSKAVVDYKPLGTYGTGKTIELAFKVANAADYTEDIIRFATSQAGDFMGVRIKPNNIVIHSNLLRENDITQGYNLKDEEFVHVLITIVKNYKTNYGNLAQIYVNGIKACSFEFSGSDSWINQSVIELGSDTADLYLYKMRVFEIGFGWQDATRNFISCLPDAASKQAAHEKLMSCVDDSYKLDYDKVKGKFNTFVVEMLGNNPLPSYLVNNKDYEAPCNFWVDIVGEDTPINGEYLDQMIEGQGTTSMDYWRWNLRSKTDSIRITAKKNYASSMHSHKMGATSLFNDLNALVVGANEAGGRVAVYQYPVYGFQKILVEGTTDQYVYEPIGLYTIGPDKGDKPTFGYDNQTYKPTLIHMEGSDHSPKSVGMDYPWSELTYSASVESLGAKNAQGTAIAAWEVGACAGLSTDEASDEAAVLAYLEQEFKPAYECDYKNTTMIVGVSSIADVNADIPTFQRAAADNGFTNGDCLVWVDGEYDTYYYNVVSQTYVKDGLNILTDLGISESDISGMSIEEKNNRFRELRRERYKATMGNYWHLRDNLFHYCFLTLFAATDNFKKNSYPYKFGTLASGSRWRWRQDDLDTLFDIDNQGLANKIYSILNGDTATGSTTQLFRGNSSYHWVLIKECYEAEIRAMYVEILEAMASLSPYGTSNIDKVIGCVRAYFWDKAQEYFPMSAYNADAEWSYEDAWPPYTDGTYEVGVHPLRQSLGSHYEAERAWVTYRLIFMASMVGFGPFAVDNQTDRSLGQISFRPSGTNTFQFTPAIDLNPTVLIGASDAKSAGTRVKAGDTAELVVSVGSDGDTTTYLQAADYMQDIGDLSKLAVNENNPSLNISSKRLQRIKVGDESAANVTTRLKTLGIGSCPSLMEIEARNLSTLTGEIDLSRCPRLKKALFGGTGVSAIQLPDGSKVTELDLPATLLNLSLVNLPKLTEEGLTYPNLTALTYLRVEGNANIEGFGLLKAAMAEDGSLSAIRVIGFDYDGDSTDMQLLLELADGGYFGINEKGEIDNTIIPVLEGSIHIAGTASQDNLDLLGTKFPSLVITADQIINYFRFADPEVERIVAENWGDGTGTSLEQIQTVTSIGEVFSGNTVIQTFDEFGKFVNAQAISDRAFNGCSSLESIDLSLAEEIGDTCFYNCSSLDIDMNLPNVTIIKHGGFNSTTSLKGRVNLPNLETIQSGAFAKSGIEYVDNLGKVTELGYSDWWGGSFQNCQSLKEVVLPDTLSVVTKHAFYQCQLLEKCEIPSSVTKIEDSAFRELSNLDLVNLVLPQLTSIGNASFLKVPNLESVVLDNIQTMGELCFSDCDNLKSVVLGKDITQIDYAAFIWNELLENVVLKANVPPTLGTRVFEGSTCPLYVPDASVEAYKTATNWVTYADRIMSMFYYLGYIDFADSAVRDICVANFDTDADGVVSIEEAAAVTDIGTLFKNNKEITSFDEFKYFTGVTSIAQGVINTITNLKSITLPSSITSLPYGCFNSLKYIEYLDFSHVTGLSNSCCSGCSELKEVKFSDALTGFGQSPFLNCDKLSTISLAVGTTGYVIEDGIMYTSDKSELQCCPPGVNVETYTAPESLIKLRVSSFAGNKSIVEFISNHLITITDRCFYGCSNLKDIKLTAGSTIGGQYVFQNTSIERFVVPANATVSGAPAIFGNIGSLKTFIIEEGVTFGSGINTFVNSPLSSFIVNISTPFVLHANTFSGSTNIVNGTGFIYVPASSVEQYKVTSGFDVWASQIKPINVADTLPDISTVAENDLYKIGEVYWKAELVDSVLTWVEI